MKNFKAKKKYIKDYKSKEHYLDAVYRNNKEIIDATIPKGPDGASSKTRFKQIVKARMENDHLSLKDAIKRVANSRIFTSHEEAYSEHFYKFLKKNKDAYKEFRKMNAWNKKVDEYQFVYKGTDGKNVHYQYGDVHLTFRQSPDDSFGGIEIYKEN